jgi:Protein of unknown function (DUF3040)
MMSLPGRQQRTLDQIGQALVAEDPGLGSRFAFFARLTRHEAIPENEQVPGHLGRAILVPLLAIGLAALMAATWLIPGRGQACPAGTHAAAHNLSSLGHSAHCQPGPAIGLSTMPVR